MMLAGIMVFAQTKAKHMNPMVDLLAAKQVVVGVSYPSNRGGGGAPRGAAPAAAPTFDPPPPPAPAAGVPDVCGIVPTGPGEGEGRGGGGAARGGPGGAPGAPGAAGAARGGGGGGRGGADPNAAPPVVLTNADLATKALAYKATDYLFGSMEGGVEGPLPAFTEFMKALGAAGVATKTPYQRLTHPVIMKAPKIRDVAKASWNISQELNTGISGLMFVGVECAKEVQVGLAAMRFKSKGGTRLDNVGIAPTVWGLSDKDYREKADVWGLNPSGELVNWTIVESKKGLENVRSIAAVKGIGVLWPGAGSLGGVFTITKTDGTRGRDDVAWENSIQQVLAACKEFNVACGYPAGAQEKNADGTTNPGYIEFRMKQGFTVFVMQSFDDNAFKAVDIGRKAAGRPATNN